jgi:16S rRNA (guanine527-N7)-methyltransferase
VTGRDALVEALRRSQDQGFLGPGPVEAHLDHAAAFVAATPPPAAFLDLGSGGGVPGLVLALTWSDAVGVLVDAQARRVRFLAEALDALGVGGRVAAVHGRAEDLARDPAHRGRYDVVTARSFGPPARTAECGAGFLRAGGCLVVAEPPGAPAERWPSSGLAGLGLGDDGVVTAAGGSVRRLVSTDGPLPPVPRRTPAMRRRPAWS